MTRASTLPTEASHPPRRLTTGTWALVLLATAYSLILAASAAAAGAQVYAWGVFATTALFSLALVIEDERTHTLPNRITGSLAVFGAVQVLGISLRTHDLAVLGITVTVAGGIGILYAALAAAGQMGFGDVKYATALALILTPYAGVLTLYMVVIAFVASAMRMMVRLARGVDTRHPHGASLAIAALTILAVAIAAGPAFPLT